MLPDRHAAGLFAALHCCKEYAVLTLPHRRYLANPDLVHRFKVGAELNKYDRLVPCQQYVLP